MDMNNTTVKLPASIRRFAPIIVDYWRDSDGYWAALKMGLCFTSNRQCHTAREDTLKELAAELSSVETCNCKECKAER